MLAACAPDPAPLYRPTATVEEIMRGLIDPSADAIWDAVVTDATAGGIVETRPETTDDWAALRHHAVMIAEATNLLIVEGRRIAAPESRSELPGVDFHPNAIQALVAEDWAVSSERRNISAIIRVTDSEEARCSVDEQTMAGD